METKKLIIIGILLIIICLLAGAIFGTLTNHVNYERIEITPNGTTIEVPTENAKYEGEINDTGSKLWTFKQGSLTTFNSEEAINARGLNGLSGAIGIKAINDLVLNHFEKQEKIDGFTVYTIDGEKLGIEGRNTLYCIITGNETSHDNIIIVTDNKDITLHMAKSIQYKNANVSSPNADVENSVNSNSNSNGISQEDLEKAKQEGYDSGYMDGYDDSYIDDEDYEYEPSSSSSSSSSVETTTEAASSESSQTEGATDVAIETSQ